MKPQLDRASVGADRDPGAPTVGLEDAAWATHYGARQVRDGMSTVLQAGAVERAQAADLMANGVPAPRRVMKTRTADRQYAGTRPVPNRAAVSPRNEPRQARLTSARQVGQYKIGQEIGRGAASRVFTAHHTSSVATVALKEFRSSPADVDERQVFLTEARILGSVRHPCVIELHDLVDDEHAMALVTELVDRGSLRRHIGAGLGLAQAGAVLGDVLSGLSGLASRRIAHLDIKPDNLLVTASGRIKVADFGVAQELSPHAEMSAWPRGGTPQYMAPEVATGTTVGLWTDLYAVGILAFELLVGHPPFAGVHDPVEIVACHITDAIPNVCELIPGTPSKIADWIARLVAKTPADRPSSALAAWDDLDKLLTECLGTSWRLGAQLTT